MSTNAINGIHLSNWRKLRKNWFDLGYDPKDGADHRRDLIQDHIEDVITDFYLEKSKRKKDLKAVILKRPHYSLSLLMKRRTKTNQDCCA